MSAPSYNAATPLPTNAAVKAPADASQEPLTAEIDSSETPERIQANIDQLGTAVWNLERKFCNLSFILQKIDDQGNFPTNHLPKWNELHVTYSSLLATSQQIAITLGWEINQFVECIIPLITNLSKGNKTECLDEFLRDHDALQIEAEGNMDGFRVLRRGIDEFRNDVAPDQQGLNEELDTLHKSFCSVFERLGAFPEIFSIVKADVQCLKMKFKDAQTDEGPKLHLQLLNISRLYKSIHFALDEYALATGSHRDR